MAQARSARAINRREKKRGFVTYGTDREEEVSKIFIISILFACRDGFGSDFYSHVMTLNF